MRLKQLTASRAVAIILVFAVAQISLQIGYAQQFIARLTSTRGSQPILVNGLSAAPGASIVTGATIETLSDQTAEINLGSFGTIELGPNTQLQLDYDQDGNTKVRLIRGCAVLRSKKGAKGEIVTEQGPAAENDKKKNSVLDVCFINGQTTVNQNAAANAISGAAGAGATTGGGGLSGAATAAIIAAVGGGVLIAVLVSREESIRPNPSPSTPN